MLLLNVYVAVLITLQHEADRSSYISASNANADTRMDAAALANIRLVTVVRLCSFLIKRQYQAVTSYLSHQSPLPSSQQHDLSGSCPPSPPLSATANREVISDREIEV